MCEMRKNMYCAKISTFTVVLLDNQSYFYSVKDTEEEVFRKTNLGNNDLVLVTFYKGKGYLLFNNS